MTTPGKITSVNHVHTVTCFQCGATATEYGGNQGGAGKLFTHGRNWGLHNGQWMCPNCRPLEYRHFKKQRK